MQKRARQTHQAIIEAAADEFAENGYQGTNTKSIAGRAEVSVGSVYRYFADKSELLHNVASARYDRLLQAIQYPPEMTLGDVPDVARHAVESVLSYHRRRFALHDVIQLRRRVDQLLDELAARTDKILIERTIEMMRRLGARGDVEFMGLHLLSMIEASTRAHLASPIVDDERFIDGLTRAVALLVRDCVQGGGDT